MPTAVRRGGAPRRWALFSLVFVFLLGLASCKPILEPEVRGLAGVELGRNEAGNWVVSLKVRAFNPNRKSLKLTKLHVRVWMDGSELGTVTLEKTAVLPGETEKVVDLPLALKFRSKSDEFRVVLGGLTGGLKRLEVEGNLHGRIGLFGKGIHFGRQPLSRLLAQFGSAGLLEK